MNIVGQKIEGVYYNYINRHRDERGWLSELFRSDELDNYNMPEMAYVSFTNPGVVRGPHEHKKQTDLFIFLDYYTLYLYDNRRRSKTHKATMKIVEETGFIVVVPPGIIHAYKRSNMKYKGPGLVINLPDQLYAGKDKKKKVDEIRYENDASCPLKIT